jgi:hypothetical protein
MVSVDLSTRERVGHVVAALRGEQDPCGLVFTGSGDAAAHSRAAWVLRWAGYAGGAGDA